jgi:hypothetical protein
MSVRYFEHVNFRPCIVRTSLVLSSAEGPRLQQLIRAQSTPQGLAQSVTMEMSRQRAHWINVTG